ncbi:ATP-dependent DNA helicase RecG [Thermodesulfobacteriota bacterium]
MVSRKNSHPKQIQTLSIPLTRLKGVGPGRAALLARRGLYTILDLFYFTPVRYEDRTRISPINCVADGSPSLVRGRVIYGKDERFYSSRKRLFKIVIRDDESDLELLWFQYRTPYLAGFAKPGTDLTVYGIIKNARGRRQMIHPDITISDSCGAEDILGFSPVYPSVKGISGKILRSFIRTSLDAYLDCVIDPVPESILSRLDLPGLRESIRNVHFPPEESSLELLNRSNTPFHKRLLFDRFFYVMLTIAFRKMSREKMSKPAYLIPKDIMKEIKKFFQFSLTSDQLKAVKEIAEDLSGGKPMNRLIMGDVGTGKTVLAAVGAFISIRNNRQVTMMVPTQILAEQHMDWFSGLPEEMGFRPVLLTGDIKKTWRKEIYGRIREGQYNLVIGTHSLIQEGLVFADLGLAIIDEQHRFGVRQRSLIDRKGDSPHILVMTATPIPRTLAIIFYGDMDISVIKEYPKGRIPVETCLVKEAQKRWVFETVKQKISSGQQTFVICPVIEESEERDLKGALEMEKRLRKILSPPFRTGIIHGRLPSDEKEKIMRAFRKGMIDLLVGTTVIEVGLHVPNATVMVIEHPERFGLTQLHQLRGRVGRGTKGGMCILMLSDNLSTKAVSRLKALAGNLNGFEIAQKDLELRGHGELTGIRQSGVGELDIFEMLREPDLLLDAKCEAQNLIESDPELLVSDHRHLKVMMKSMSEIPLGL